MKTPRFFAAVALWLLVSVAHADFSGVVVSILDGDTVDVLVDRKPVRVRLAEIDAPERRRHSAPGHGKRWRPPRSSSSSR